MVSACPVTLDPTYDACEGDTLVLDSNGDPSYSYQWFLNGVLISGASDPTLVVTEGGMYQVDATDGTTNCSDVTTVTFDALPIDTGFFEMILCDDTINGSTDTDGLSTFDLTSMEAEITNGDVTLIVIWYETMADEMNDMPLADPTQFQNTVNPQTVFYRVQNGAGCKYVKPFSLAVNPLPSPTVPTPLVSCDTDGDGFSLFDLTSKDVEIANGEPGVTILYYETAAEAEIGDPLSALVSPYSNITAFSQTVYARVSNELIFNLFCFRVVELELIVNPIPDAPDVSFQDPLIAVDTDGDGVEEFDLTLNEAAILGVQNPGDFQPITYYVSEADANSQSNPIAVPSAFSSTGQTIYPLLQNAVTGCFRISPFDIVVEGVPINIPPDDLFIDEGDLNGLAIFDLTVNEAQMLGPLDPAIHDFTYHISVSDANNGANAFANPAAYQNVTNPQLIHVRLTNTNTNAYVIASFAIETDGVLGVDDQLSNSFAMYPNPSRDLLTISSEILRDVVIAVHETNGRLVLTEAFKTNIVLDVSNLASGMYYVVLSSEGNRIVKPLIIE